MMNFRHLVASIIKILGTAADGRFRVVGYASQSSNAEQFVGSNREVTVYYQQGDFSGSPTGGGKHHALTLVVELTVSAKARMDLRVINREAATPAQISAALAAATDAGYEADRAWDELAEIVYQILMDGRNYDLGLDVGDSEGRFVTRIQKGEVSPKGELVTLTGTLTLECGTVETVTGDPGVAAAAPIVDHTINVEG